MHPILYLINTVISAYITLVIISFIISLLIQFGIANRYNPLVQQITTFLGQITEPAYRIIRKYLPKTQLVYALSPMILIIALQVIQYTINYYWPL